MIYLNIYRRKNGDPETESFDDYSDAVESLARDLTEPGDNGWTSSLTFEDGQADVITAIIERDAGIQIETWDSDARYMRQHGGL